MFLCKNQFKSYFGYIVHITDLGNRATPQCKCSQNKLFAPIKKHVSWKHMSEHHSRKLFIHFYTHIHIPCCAIYGGAQDCDLSSSDTNDNTVVTLNPGRVHFAFCNSLPHQRSNDEPIGLCKICKSVV